MQLLNTRTFQPRDINQIARFEVSTALKIQVVVLLVMTSCSIVVGYQCFGGPCLLHLQTHYKASKFKRPRHEFQIASNLLVTYNTVRFFQLLC